MGDYIFLMHNDAVAADDQQWEPYIRRLQQRGCFQGGSAIGDGACLRKAARLLP